MTQLREPKPRTWRALALLGCSSLLACQGSLPAAPVDLGTNDGPAMQRPPTQFPTGSTPDLGPTREPYPIVLAHGMSGFKNIGPLDYFYGVADALRKDGHDIYVSQVDPFNSSDVRGAQLLDFVRTTLEASGAKKLNLICHSQGGFDCRYVANKLPDRIAAVVTIATPHLGDPIADIAENNLPGPLQQALEAFLNILGSALDQGSADDAKLGIVTCSTKGAKQFTADYPNQPGVAYYSIAGRSNNSVGDDNCNTPTEPPFIARWDAYVDPVNVLLAPTGAILNGSFHPTPVNDGLVPVGAAKWGTFLGCIPADHLDEVGQIGGQSPGQGNAFDHLIFYRQLADWLVQEGF